MDDLRTRFFRVVANVKTAIFSHLRPQWTHLFGAAIWLCLLFVALFFFALPRPARLFASSDYGGLLSQERRHDSQVITTDEDLLTTNVDSPLSTAVLIDTPTLVVTQPLTTATVLPTSSPTFTETPTEAPLPTDTVTPVPLPTETATPTFMPAVPTQTETPTGTPDPPTQTPTSTATETPAEAPTPTETPTETQTPIGVDPPAIYISEFMADPRAVNDRTGEYIELFNAGDAVVDLAGWRIEDLGTNKHTIGAELPISPGQYLVLGRSGTLTETGGVAVDYVYSSFDLANGDDEIYLLAPDGTTIDSVAWVTTTLPIAAGISWERSDFTMSNSWVAASSPWPGSAGDWGSPGFAYGGSHPTPTIVPSPTDLSTATPVPTSTLPDLTPTSTPPTPSLTPTPTEALPSPTSGPPARIRISEFLANPDAVGDEVGEFIELFNAGETPTNLNGWILADLDTDNFVINVDLVIQPGQYLVLARNADSTLDVATGLPINGGLSVDFVFAGMSLANGDDEILLLTPAGQEVDRVVWGGASGNSITAGASLERTAFGPDGVWVTAQTPWPGSAGDAGSPGAAYVPPVATPTPTDVPPTEMPTVPPATAFPTPIIGPPPAIFISEFLADPKAAGDDAGEFIELFNAAETPANLNGWILADLGTDNFVIDVDLVIQPGQYLVLARSDDVTLNGGLPVDYPFNGMSLANGSDEILLLTPTARKSTVFSGATGQTSRPVPAQVWNALRSTMRVSGSQP